MIRSMTGFGKAVRQLDGQTITVEISSVNHRFLDTSLRMPNEWSPLDPDLRDLLKHAIARGKINVSINRKRGSIAASSVRFDADVARRYIEAAQEISAMAGSSAAITVETIAPLTGVFYYQDDEEELDRVRDLLMGAIEDAVKNLNAMREAEGRTLLIDLTERVELIRAALGRIEARLPELNGLYEERLRTRIGELNGEANIAEDRIAMEVAVMAERGDVTEETVRLSSHLDHAMDLLNGDEAAGRKMNFLSQEMQREINTLGSKVRDSDVSREVLEMKSEVEKLREQIQNIE